MQLINTDIVRPQTDIFWQTPYGIQDRQPRPVLVITTAFANQAEEDQLLGILRAGCKLRDDQFNIIQLQPGEHLAWYRIKDICKPRIALLFHIYPSQLGISALFKLNDVNNFDGVICIPSVPLGQLIADKTLKGQLWNNALKPVFENQTFGN